MNKNAILILGGVILVLVVLAVARGGNRELPVVSTDTVQARDIVERVSASGKIQPEIEVKITAEVNGQIIDLPVKEGDVVKKGDLLVQLNPDIYEAALLRAEASLNSARSNLASARAQVAQGEANQFAAAKAFERAKTLLASKVISQAEFDQNEASYLTANANLTSAKESVRSAEFAIRSGEASLQEARDNLSRTTLVAPQAGVVTALSSSRTHVFGTRSFERMSFVRPIVGARDLPNNMLGFRTCARLPPRWLIFSVAASISFLLFSKSSLRRADICGSCLAAVVYRIAIYRESYLSEIIGIVSHRGLGVSYLIVDFQATNNWRGGKMDEQLKEIHWWNHGRKTEQNKWRAHRRTNWQAGRRNDRRADTMTGRHTGKQT